MGNKQLFSTQEALAIGKQLGIDLTQIDLEQFRRGLMVELKHCAQDLQTNVISDDPLLTGKIAWAHLKETKDYYTRLDDFAADA